jgi:uncharacterized membrane protein
MSSRADAGPEVIQRVQEAKRPVSAVAGPYGHPFHPILVTLPIGAWVCSLVFDVATKLDSAGRPALVEGSYWLIGIGIVGALVAAVFGLLDLVGIPRGTRALKIGLTHLCLNLVVVAIFAVDFAWRHSDYYEVREVRAVQLILSAVGLAVLAASGWLGGQLAYRYGVRVAEEAAQADGYR